jgi:general stress protein YciG
MATQDRGFASMDREKQREIARKGGIAAHEKGTAHEWSPAEAREAGRKGGIASHRKRTDETGAAPADTPPAPEPDRFSSDW